MSIWIRTPPLPSLGSESKRGRRFCSDVEESEKRVAASLVDILIFVDGVSWLTGVGPRCFPTVGEPSVGKVVAPRSWSREEIDRSAEGT